MKVFIATSVSFPSGMAATNRIKCYAKGLIANGIECEVVTTSSMGAGSPTDEIPYKRFCKYNSTPRNRLLKVIINRYNVLQQSIYLIRNLKKNDVVLFFGIQKWIGLSYKVACLLKNAKLIEELCEIPYFNDSFKNKIKRWIQIHLFFKIFDGFIPISEELSKLARKYGSRNSKILKVPILIDFSRLDNVNTFNNFHFSELPYIFYAGDISEHKDGIVSSIKAFMDASRKISFKIYYIIAGPESEDLKSILGLAKESQMEDKIIYSGNLSAEEVMVYLKNSMLFISNKNDNIQNRNGFSTKLGEVLISEVAIITTNVGEPNYYLKDGVSAYIVDFNRIDLISDKIVQAFANPTERKKIAEAGKLIAQKEFDCIYQGKRMSNFLKQI